MEKPKKKPIMNLPHMGKIKYFECGKNKCVWYNRRNVHNCDNPDCLDCKNNKFKEYEVRK